MKKLAFSPLAFLASLGAGGIAVMPFAFLQYTQEHPEGLIRFSHIHTHYETLSFATKTLFFGLEATMIFFVILHFVLSVVFFRQLISFVKSDHYAKFIGNPLANSAILAPFISLAMTMNVFIGPIRYFIEPFSDNLQTFMLPAFLALLVLFAFLLRMEIKLLKTSFTVGFDVSKIHFGWLLHPFALGMITVTATGIAAMATNSSIAHTAAFLSLISGTMGVFLLVVKLITLFTSHFAAPGLPEKQFLPSLLIVIPNITLYAISLFRIGHYLEHQHGAHLDAFFFFVIAGSFAFEIWYLLFGTALLSDYFRNHYFRGEFTLSQWGLICPFVAFAVLGSFFSSVFFAHWIVSTIILLSGIFVIGLYVDLLIRHARCAGWISRHKTLSCE
jgi:hypothetical protein